ncbi:MAG: hypothetical protein QG573_1405 [Acidobacteriota bacterium]|nr:hypothetical protein [Acidobacteriota bacterium]
MRGYTASHTPRWPKALCVPWKTRRPGCRLMVRRYTGVRVTRDGGATILGQMSSLVPARSSRAVLSALALFLIRLAATAESSPQWARVLDGSPLQGATGPGCEWGSPVGRSVSLSPDGAVLASAWASSPPASSANLLTRIAPNGVAEWRSAVQLLGPTEPSGGRPLLHRTRTDGSLVVASADRAGSAGALFLAAFAASGRQLWAANVYQGVDNFPRLVDFDLDQDGHGYLLGAAPSGSPDNQEAFFLLHLDPDGVELGAQTWPEGKQFYSLEVLGSRRIALAGEIVFPLGDYWPTGLVTVVDFDGGPGWSLEYLDDSAPFSYFRDIEQNLAGELFAAGAECQDGYPCYPLLVKIVAGEVQWSARIQNYGTTGGSTVAVAQSGAIYMAGAVGTPVTRQGFVARFEASGETSWVRTAGDHLTRVHLGPNDDATAVGWSHAAGDSLAVAVRWNESGEVQWQDVAGAQNRNLRYCDAVAGSGGVEFLYGASSDRDNPGSDQKLLLRRVSADGEISELSPGIGASSPIDQVASRGVDFSSRPFDIAADGTVLIAGSSQSSMTNSPATIWSLDSRGGLRSEIHTPVYGAYSAYFSSTLQGEEGDHYLVGASGYPADDLFVTRIGPDGGSHWWRSLGRIDPQVLPLEASHPSGGVYISAADAGAACPTMRLIHVAADGEERWSVRPLPGRCTRPRAILAPESGGLFVLGEELSPAGARQCVALSLDPLGSVRWVRRIPGLAQGDTSCAAMTVDSQGALFAIGENAGQPLVAALQPDGSVAWIRVGFDGQVPDGGLTAIVLDASGRLIVGGGARRPFYALMTKQGATVVLNRSDIESDGTLLRLALYPDGSVVAAGAVDLDGAHRPFFASWTQSGNFAWYKPLPYSMTEVAGPFQLAVDPNGSAIVAMTITRQSLDVLVAKGPGPRHLFSDGFDWGDLSQWSGSDPGRATPPVR